MQAANKGAFSKTATLPHQQPPGATARFAPSASDFAALTEQLLADLATEQGLPHPVQVAPDLLQRLAAHPGPATCANTPACCCTACAMLAEGEDTLGWEHLGDDIVQALQTAAPALVRSIARADHRQGRQPAAAVLSLQELSSAAIDQALQARAAMSRRRHASWASAARRCTASWLRGCIDLLLNT